ncbi:MAG: hypothetical protein WCW45_03090 [Patescibacteria group bacterium]
MVVLVFAVILAGAACAPTAAPTANSPVAMPTLAPNDMPSGIEATVAAAPTVVPPDTGDNQPVELKPNMAIQAYLVVSTAKFGDSVLVTVENWDRVGLVCRQLSDDGKQTFVGEYDCSQVVTAALYLDVYTITFKKGWLEVDGDPKERVFAR